MCKGLICGAPKLNIYHVRMSPERSIDRMYECMYELNLEPVDVYKKLGIGRQRFFGWKQRGSIPKAFEIPLCELFNVRIEWLKTGEEPKHPPQFVGKSGLLEYDKDGRAFPFKTREPEPDELSQLELDVIRELRILDACVLDSIVAMIHTAADIVREKQKKEQSSA